MRSHNTKKYNKIKIECDFFVKRKNVLQIIVIRCITSTTPRHPSIQHNIQMFHGHFSIIVLHRATSECILIQYVLKNVKHNQNVYTFLIGSFKLN